MVKLKKQYKEEFIKQINNLCEASRRIDWSNTITNSTAPTEWITESKAQAHKNYEDCLNKLLHSIATIALEKYIEFDGYI